MGAFFMSTTSVKNLVEKLFEVGAHYGYSRSRRHPSTSPFIFGTKGTVEIFDLEKTGECLKKAKEFVATLAKEGKRILFVTSKKEFAAIITKAATSIAMPYVASRWVGGTLTNFDEIRKRIDRLIDLEKGRDSGEHEKYTKHERLLIEREIADLRGRFGGIATLDARPAALFVIDPKQEETAVREASRLGIPTVALSSSDCDIRGIQYPIPANDANIKSVELFVEEIVGAYKEGQKK